MNKICTTLEQSQKLIELGVDVNTADMYWWYSGKRYYLGTMDDDDFNEKSDIPAWSLVALLDVLPLEIETHTQTDGHKIYYYVESYMKRMGKEIYLSTERHENLVDACYEMIIKLNEMNLL